MNSCVIDIVCFYGADKRSYVVKEMAIVNTWSLAEVSFIFFPPYVSDNQPTNKWLTKNFHGLKWEDGFIPYSCLGNIIRKYGEAYQTIYVKGGAKLKTVKEFLTGQNIIDLETLNCPSLRTLTQPQLDNICAYHTEQAPYHVCAKRQGIALAKWLRKLEIPEESWD